MNHRFPAPSSATISPSNIVTLQVFGHRQIFEPLHLVSPARNESALSRIDVGERPEAIVF
jgi:hypothetical protein